MVWGVNVGIYGIHGGIHGVSGIGSASLCYMERRGGQFESGQLDVWLVLVLLLTLFAWRVSFHGAWQGVFSLIFGVDPSVSKTGAESGLEPSVVGVRQMGSWR